MDECNPKVLTGAVEAVGLEGGAVVRIELDGQAERGQQAAEAETQRREVLVEVVAPFGDIARVVVDEGAQEGPARLVVRPDAHVGAMVEIGDHELEGGVGLDASEGSPAEGVELAPRHAEPGEMAIEGGTGDLERLRASLADEDVDDALGGALVFPLAFVAEANGLLQELEFEGTERPAIRTPLGA